MLVPYCDVSAVDVFGNTALLLAINGNGWIKGKERLECVKALCHYGSMNQQNKVGESALLLGARIGKLPVVQALIDVGADVHVRNRYAQNALHMVCQSEGREAIVALLLAKGVDAKAPDFQGMTPCIWKP